MQLQGNRFPLKFEFKEENLNNFLCFTANENGNQKSTETIRQSWGKLSGKKGGYKNERKRKAHASREGGGIHRRNTDASPLRFHARVRSVEPICNSRTFEKRLKGGGFPPSIFHFSKG